MLPGTQKMAWAGGASMVLSWLCSCRPTLLGWGSTPQSLLLLRVEETVGPRWLAATGTAVWPAAATAAEEEEEVLGYSLPIPHTDPSTSKSRSFFFGERGQVTGH